MPNLPFIEAGFAKELLLFATYPESIYFCVAFDILFSS
jgi:hypothetical protein